MELRELETFYMAATLLNFTKASLALNYAQSTVSAQIQSLETELGTPLFNRLGKRITLTDAGRNLLDYAVRMLELAEQARATTSHQEEPEGMLTISALESILTYRLPAILRRYQQTYPGVRLVFQPSRGGTIQRRVLDGSVDVGFVLDPQAQTASLIAETVVEEPLLLLVAPDHRLGGRGTIAAEDIARETLLLTERGCGYRLAFEHALREAGATPFATLEFDSVEALKQCTMAGLGLALLPAMTVRTELDEGRIAALEWDGHDICFYTQMIRHRDRWVSPAMAAFMEMVQQAFRELV